MTDNNDYLKVQAVGLHAGYLEKIVEAVIDSEGTKIEGPLKRIEIAPDAKYGSRIHLTIGPTTTAFRGGDLVGFPNLTEIMPVPEFKLRP